MNKAESERLGSLFEKKGYQATSTADEADVIVLNGCVVRQHAEDRIVNKLNALRVLKRQRPDVMLAVTGCLVNSDTEKLSKDFPHIDHFFQPGDSPPWLEKVKQDEIGLR
jgi:tRNA-2-methylthio-N6-dimethylallyladenosine synthase